MEHFKIKNITFTYPGETRAALSGITLSVPRGAFITICGASGCGKTTLLRLLKPALSPKGVREGTVFYEGQDLETLGEKHTAAGIGFVMQNPAHQIVTDTVWHEMAFGLENMGLPSSEIRMRVSEMASFFGMQTWFHKNTADLSGGQKQLLNLAAVMAMHPSVLLLDEPTAQLDPIAAEHFLETVAKINRELGTTVLLTEHRLEEAIPLSDRVVVMQDGKIMADAAPRDLGRILYQQENAMRTAMPAPMQVWGALSGEGACPVTVRKGRAFLLEHAKTNPPRPIQSRETPQFADCALKAEEVWFRYTKEGEDVLRSFSVQIQKGEIFAVVGGNGSGKTTALHILSGLITPYSGKVGVCGKPIEKSDARICTLPQNPETLFLKDTVREELLEGNILEERFLEVAALFHIEAILDRHPYDLSGGELQRAALAKVLLCAPDILLLDEPTKGMDAHFKNEFAAILKTLSNGGTTIVLVSHDISFCAAHATRCALMFDGGITASGEAKAFFSGKYFYTTSAARMAKDIVPNAVLTEDILSAFGKAAPEIPAPQEVRPHIPEKKEEPKKKIRPKRVWSVPFALLFLFSCILQFTEISLFGISVKTHAQSVQLFSIVTLFLSLLFFLPKTEQKNAPGARRKLTKRTWLSMAVVGLLIPFTIFAGIVFLEDRKYSFISLLIILETMVPFAAAFESRKPNARELILISVLCAIVVAGRAAFFALPQFKPTAALVILAGVCLGGETGFLVGAVSAFVSNIFFGQGPWTPWQMFALGILGFLAGIVFRRGLLPKTKLALSIFGGLSVVFLYGGILNPASVLMMQMEVTWESVIASYALGFPLDVIHAASTVFFLWFLSEPMLEKLERVKTKYGIQ